MTTVDTSGKIVTGIMTLEFCGSRISGKGVQMYKGTGFALLILSHFSQISHENEIITDLT